MNGRLCFAIFVKFIARGRPAEATVASVFICTWKKLIAMRLHVLALKIVQNIDRFCSSDSASNRDVGITNVSDPCS